MPGGGRNSGRQSPRRESEYAQARRRSLRHDHPRTGDVMAQIPGLLELECLRIVDLDVEACAVDVQLLPVSGHSERETGAARKFRLSLDGIVREIEAPEFAAF